MSNDTLRVCLDYSPVANCRTGLGRYAERLGRALLACDGIEAGYCAATADLQRVPAYARERLLAHWPWGMKRWRGTVLLAHLLGQSWDRRFASVDLVHCTEHLLLPLRRIPAVLTVHDVVYVTHPEWHLPWNHRYLRLAMPMFARRARAIIAVSEHTKREVVQFLRVPADKVHVVYEGVEKRFAPVRDPERLAAVQARYGLQPPFILAVGAIEPRKNLALLIRAFAALCLHSGFQHQLVIAGGRGWLYDDVFATAELLGLGNRCRFPGYIADEDLPALYSAADVFAHPAHFEGFGLPPLEAMACGTPIVASAATSLPEVVGEAGLLAPPRDEAAWVEALRLLTEDRELHDRLAAEGQERAARFTWEETARRTVEVYRAVLEQA
ncbi:MAG: glycosyltransferase family 4 protein [Anaerolineae bacterium]